MTLEPPRDATTAWKYLKAVIEADLLHGDYPQSTVDLRERAIKLVDERMAVGSLLDQGFTFKVESTGEGEDE